MPSPFPGMDPYLEEPGLWPDVHHGLMSQMQADLNRLLGPSYFVRLEERLFVSDEEDPGRRVIVPDLRISDRPGVAGQPRPTDESSSVAVAEPLVVTTLNDEEIREPFLQVIDSSNRQVITVIEVVSPTNKVANSRGRDSYQRKKREVTTSPCHWVEIDLLRDGLPVVPVVADRGDYFVHVSRAADRPRGLVWPIRLPQRLPVIRIPVRAGEPDARLDLQAVLDTAYDRAAYDRFVDYRRPPEPPLPPNHAAWADALLREKGLR